MTAQLFEPKKAEAFAERMLDILNSGAIAIMTSIGHRTGLFDMMADLPPCTSQMLENAGFNRVEIKQLAHDFQNNYYIVRKS